MANSLPFELPPSTLEEEMQVGDDSSTNFPNSNRFRQESFKAYKKAASACVTSSTLKKCTTEHEPCIKDQDDLNKQTDNDPVNSTAYPEETMNKPKRLSIETGVKKYSVSVKNPLIDSYFTPIREEIKLSDLKRLTLSEESSSIGKIPDPLNISRFSNKRKDPNSSSDAEFERNIPGAIKKMTNTNKVMRLESSAPPSYLSSFEKDKSPLATENSKIHAFRHDAEKRMQERNARRFVFVSSQATCGDQATTNSNTTSKHSFPFFNLPSVKSAPTKESESFYQDFKSSVSSAKFPTNALHELLSILETWARSGLDNAFNRPLKSSSVDGKADLEKNLKYGLDLLNQMVTRIYTLMRAANKLPNADAILQCKLEQIRSDIINTGVNMWNTIEEIESQISNDYSKLISNREEVSETSAGDLENEESGDIESQVSSDHKSLESISDTAEETSSEDMEQESKDMESLSGEDSETSSEDVDQEAKPNILNTNAYTLVTERLPLLWIQEENFREKIRVFCSEMDEIL